MFTRTFTTSLCAVACILTISQQATASPTQMVHVETPECDPLFIPTNVEEIGDFNVFPGTDEDLDATLLGQTPHVPCPASNNTGLPELLVDIRNLTGRAWAELWYVADPETTITNYDGEANEFPFSPLREAFRIDAVGVNRPLVSESINANGIWEIGESWQFVLQDYTNSLGLPADAITSIGVGDGSTLPAAGIVDSSGSIIGVPVPEPASIALLGVGAAMLIRRKPFSQHH